jgi:hypothetical protein
MDGPSDQDIDTAGTEADAESVKARTHRAETRGVEKGEPAAPAQPPGSTGPARGSDPRTLHRREDDDVAEARSPEFNDRSDEDRNRD